MKFSIYVVAGAAPAFLSLLAQSFVLPSPTENCSTFTEAISSSLADQQITVINTTLVLSNSTSQNIYEYCLVNAQVAYTKNDTLSFQMYLPDASAWTGRFMAVGNGGLAGTIDNVNMLEQLNLGFAVAGGDSGHLATLNNEGNGAPGVYLPFLHDVNQVEAWIHNAISIFTGPAKSIVHGYYGSPARYSYYDGCSTGGAQGFSLAQFHPDLFDGIYAGSPGNWYSHLALSFLWNAVNTQNESQIPLNTLNAITAAVLDECDTLDGVQDGMLENPLMCKFDINSMSCNSSTANASSCLTDSQLGAAKKIYAGPTSTINGDEIYPGFTIGSEASWFGQEGIIDSLADDFSIPLLQNLVYDSLHYNAVDFNFGSNVADMDSNCGQYIDAITTDLSAFKNHGGKIIVTQGWADPYNVALWPIQHMQDLETFFGGDISDFYNLFMVPGGGHCGTTSFYPSSPGTYHVAEALVSWVERGEKPSSVLSTGTTPAGQNISRLLCPWPQTATYTGGDISTSSSYVCEI